MSNRTSRVIQAIMLVAVLVILSGCNYSSYAVKANSDEQNNSAAWLVYWDLEAGEKDLEKLGSRLENVSYFGAYFDKKDHMLIPKELSDRQSQLKKRESYLAYLTFVNDKQNSDGSVVLKDIEVLRRLFANDVSMDKHVDEIIAIALHGGYKGIEIDYEKVWKDEKVSREFIKFIDRLYLKALKNNLKLRIILEPSAPFSTVDFTTGPEYVVMLYNLYGLHSGPGPKANKEFIQKIISRMEVLPGEKAVAFSTGGCMWGDNGEKRLLTELEAKTLAALYDTGQARDEESQCAFFEYQDKGVTYQVWYADVETLNYWISIAKEQGVNNISLWRFGGNVDIDKLSI